MTKDELYKNLEIMKNANAPQKDLQSLIDTYNSGNGAIPEEKPGLIQSSAQAIAKPFLSVGASAAGGLEALAAAGGKAVGADKFATDRTQDMVDIEKGVDTGYLGKARPLGAGKDGAVATGEDIAGQLLEAGSYFAAPIRGITGFWGAVKAGTPVAAMLGTGTGLEAAGEGKGAGEASLTGAANAAGVLATFGLMGKAADVFKIWGAKAMQSPVVQAGVSSLKDFADHAFESLPEAFQKNFTSLADFTNLTTRRTVEALKSQFDRNHETTGKAVVDSLLPEVNNPDLTFTRYQRGLAETMGNMFRKSNALYDDARTNSTLIDRFTISNDALSKANIPELPKTAADVKAYQEAMGKISVPFQNFIETMSKAVQKPMTLGQVINLQKESLSYLTGASNDERVAIRDFAAGLFADTHSVLEKTNPELDGLWDLSWNAWKKASDAYSSGPLNTLKSVGDVDRFVDRMTRTDMERGDRKVFLDSLGKNQPVVQDLFVNSIMRKAKDLKPNDGAKVIDDFLESSIAKDLLTPDQTKMLDSFSSFMKGDFEQFITGMRRGLFTESDLTPGQNTALDTMEKGAKDLLPAQTQLDVMKVVNDGRLDQIAEKFTKLKDSPEIAKIVSTMTSEEKSLVALSVGKDVYKAELPVATHLGDGKFKVEEGVADAILKTRDTFAANKSLEGLLTPEQITEMDKAAKMAENIKDASYNADGETLANFLRVTISAFYFKRGWLPGALSKVSETLGSLSNQVEMNRALREMIEQGLTKKGKMYKLGELLELLPKYLSVPAVKGAGETL